MDGEGCGRKRLYSDCSYYLSKCQNCLWEITKNLLHDCLSTSQDLNPGHTEQDTAVLPIRPLFLRNNSLSCVSFQLAGPFPVTDVSLFFPLESVPASSWHYRDPTERCGIIIGKIHVHIIVVLSEDSAVYFRRLCAVASTTGRHTCLKNHTKSAYAPTSNLKVAWT
jgi:hypothetical protein